MRVRVRFPPLSFLATQLSFALPESLSESASHGSGQNLDDDYDDDAVDRDPTGIRFEVPYHASEAFAQNVDMLPMSRIEGLKQSN